MFLYIAPWDNSCQPRVLEIKACALSGPILPLKRSLLFSRILTLQHGLGMRWAVDVGYITLIYTETVTVLLVRAQFILGSDAWLGGAYDHTYIHTYTPTLYH